MPVRRQRTIARPASVSGFGLFQGVDCQLIFQPAAENSGITFLRTDVRSARPIPATSDFVAKVPRRTAISDGQSTIETIEHVMAALAGLQIDNCHVELDGPEPPIGDGSSLHFVDALLRAGIVEQSTPAVEAVVTAHLEATADGVQSLTADCGDRFVIDYDLNYGAHPWFKPQAVSVTVTPQSFANDIAFARTFVLASEIEALHKLGYGRRASTANLLVLDEAGVRHDSFRRPDECARHKVLDAIGDLALCGGRPSGRFHARRTGHHVNQAMAAQLRTHCQLNPNPRRRVA
jgi:UDP-3-O-[3-hydroxymyristoyl] N-acetylglucosamine deacetylase